MVKHLVLVYWGYNLQRLLYFSIAACHIIKKSLQEQAFKILKEQY